MWILLAIIVGFLVIIGAAILVVTDEAEEREHDEGDDGNEDDEPVIGNQTKGTTYARSVGLAGPWPGIR